MDRVFVSMPFEHLDLEDGEWTKLYKYCLEPLQKPIPGEPDYEPVQLDRADKSLKSLALKENVKSLIQQCRIVLAVLTKQTILSDRKRFGHRAFNPNVLWEIGFGEPLGKPIVVIADDEAIRKLPVLAGEVKVCEYNHTIVQSCGARNGYETCAPIVKDLSAYVKLACEQARGGARGTFRATAISWIDRSHADLPNLIRSASRNVEILTTNLDFLVSPEFLRGPKALQPLESAIRRRASVKIVTMDPESIIAEYRARQLGRDGNVPGYRQELRDGIVYLYHRFREHDNFQLRLYNDLPPQITYHIDSALVTSIVTKGDRARKRIQVQFDESDQGVDRSFLAHFTSTFESATNASSIAWVINGKVGEAFQQRLNAGDVQITAEDRESAKSGRHRGSFDDRLEGDGDRATPP